MHDIKFDGNCHINAKLCTGLDQPVQPAIVWLKIWKSPLNYLCNGKLEGLLATSTESVKQKPQLSMWRLKCAETGSYVLC